MGIVVCVDATLHLMEVELVDRKALGVGLPDRMKVLPQKCLGGNAFHLATQSLCVLSIAVGYAVGPSPPIAPSPKGRNKNRVGLGRSFGVKDSLVLGEN